MAMLAYLLCVYKEAHIWNRKKMKLFDFRLYGTLSKGNFIPNMVGNQWIVLATGMTVADGILKDHTLVAVGRVDY